MLFERLFSEEPSEPADAGGRRGYTNRNGTYIARGLRLPVRGQFVRLGGVAVVLRVLLETRSDTPRRELWLHLANDCLCVLRELCVSFFAVASDLSTHEGMLPDLFSHMHERVTFSNAVALTEEALAARPGVLDIRTLPSLEPFVDCLNPFELAFFCRVLALVCGCPLCHDKPPTTN